MSSGTIQKMVVKERTNEGYILGKGAQRILLPNNGRANELSVNDEIEVFLFAEKATLQLPNVTVGTYGWADVTEVQENLGAYVDIGTIENILIDKEDLPALKQVWPKESDKLYVTLRNDKYGNLFANPAKEHHFMDLFHFADDVDLNEQVQGRVIRADREGTVIITDKDYRGFIHRTERETEPRLGELVSGRIIEVKEDGSLNVSLKPLKHERMDEDAERILQFLIDAGGEMDFGDRSDPDAIQQTFRMSKSSFKRALGRLMKQKKVQQSDGKTYLL